MQVVKLGFPMGMWKAPGQGRLWLSSKFMSTAPMVKAEPYLGGTSNREVGMPHWPSEPGAGKRVISIWSSTRNGCDSDPPRGDYGDCSRGSFQNTHIPLLFTLSETSGHLARLREEPI